MQIFITNMNGNFIFKFSEYWFYVTNFIDFPLYICTFLLKFFAKCVRSHGRALKQYVRILILGFLIFLYQTNISSLYSGTMYALREHVFLHNSPGFT